MFDMVNLPISPSFSFFEFDVVYKMPKFSNDEDYKSQ